MKPLRNHTLRRMLVFILVLSLSLCSVMFTRAEEETSAAGSENTLVNSDEDTEDNESENDQSENDQSENDQSENDQSENDQTDLGDNEPEDGDAASEENIPENEEEVPEDIRQADENNELETEPMAGTGQLLISMDSLTEPIEIDLTAVGVGSAAGYNATADTVTLTENEYYKITGGGKRLIVKSGNTANITLENVDIDVSGTANACAFDMTAATVYLTLKGSNSLKSGSSKAGLQVNSQIANIPGKLIITAESNGGLSAAGGDNGAGIGGGRYGAGGEITISGGEITAAGGGYYGAGIGGGQNGAGGKITISGGKIAAASGGSGAGIGGGYTGKGGEITILGGEITAASGNAAGIGSGTLAGTGVGAEITISGGKITAAGGSGAGIGIGSYSGSSGEGGKITITGAETEITATSDYGGAGIGGGFNVAGGEITISGGKITATGGTSGGTGIGGGYKGAGGKITISGGEITATAGQRSAGIGGGESKAGGEIIISGGKITATGGSGAGIGGGSNGAGGKITISGGEIMAIDEYAGAGIGSGQGEECGEITITGGKITAIGSNKFGAGGAGIGCGVNGAGGEITITGGEITAIGSNQYAGIGTNPAAIPKADISISDTAAVRAYSESGTALDPVINAGTAYIVNARIAETAKTNFKALSSTAAVEITVNNDVSQKAKLIVPAKYTAFAYNAPEAAYNNSFMSGTQKYKLVDFDSGNYNIPSLQNMEAVVLKKATLEAYTVTFDPNGGTFVGDSSTSAKTTEVYEGETITGYDMTKTGHSFLGWFKGDTKWNFANTVTESMTLTAKFQATGGGIPSETLSGRAAVNVEVKAKSPDFIGTPTNVLLAENMTEGALAEALSTRTIIASYGEGVRTVENVSIPYFNQGLINWEKVGAYTIDFTATFEGKGVIGTAEINVQDTTPPVIKLSKLTDTYHISTPITKEFIKSEFIESIQDNYYEDSQLEVLFEGIEGTDFTRAGQYFLFIKAKDGLGVEESLRNESESVKVEINMTRGKPVINAKSLIRYPLNGSVNIERFNKDIEATVTSDTKEQINIYIKDFSNIKFSTVGSYTVTLTAADSFGIQADPRRVNVEIYAADTGSGSDGSGGGNSTNDPPNPTGQQTYTLTGNSLGTAEPNSFVINGIPVTAVYQPETDDYAVFDEAGTPLGTLTVPEDMTLEEAIINSDIVPEGSIDVKANPKTGDDSHVAHALKLIALLLTLLELLYSVLLSYRKACM